MRSVSDGDQCGETGGSDDESRVVRDGAGRTRSALRVSRSVSFVVAGSRNRARPPAKTMERCSKR